MAETPIGLGETGLLGRKPQRRKLRIAIWVTAIILVLGLVGSTAVAVMVGWNLTHPKRKALTEDPLQYGMAFESVEFRS